MIVTVEIAMRHKQMHKYPLNFHTRYLMYGSIRTEQHSAARRSAARSNKVPLRIVPVSVSLNDSVST